MRITNPIVWGKSLLFLKITIIFTMAFILRLNYNSECFLIPPGLELPQSIVRDS